jgi:hypothetical protein
MKRGRMHATPALRIRRALSPKIFGGSRGFTAG